MHFTRSGFLKIEVRNEKEAWLDQLFKSKYLYSYGSVQLFKWVNITTVSRYGDRIYYHPREPFVGTGFYGRLITTFQPNIKLNLGAEFIYSELNKKPGNQSIYRVNIYNIFTTYQFNKYFFIRGAVRYNNYSKKLLTDFLVSFTLIPGTVMHLGYGSLYENKTRENNQWVPGDGSLLNMKNSLFFKVSYLWRIK